MRLAVLVHTPTAPTARADIEALRPLLQKPEMGFWVVEEAASDDLALGLPRALEGTPANASVLVVVMSQVQRGPAGSVEVIGTTRPVRIEELRAAVVTAAPNGALLVLDGLCAAGEADELGPAIGRAVAPASSGVGLLAALRAPGDEGPRSPLVDAFVAAAAGVLAQGAPITLQASAFANQLGNDDDLQRASASLSYLPASHDLTLFRPPPRPFTAPPSADQTFAEANALLDQGRLDEALDACKKVLFLFGKDIEKKAEVYVHIAAIKQRQGKDREAAFNLDKALAVNPRHRTALEGQIMLAVTEQRWGDVAALGERLLEVIDSAAGKAQALLDLSGVLLEGTGDEAQAAALLERARALTPEDERPLERLATIYDRSRNFEKLVAVLEGWAQATDNGYQRAARFAAAGRVASRGLGDSARAIQLLDQALRLRRDDPQISEDMAAELEREGLFAPALKALQICASAEPRRASTYRSVIRLADRVGRPALAGAAAMALCHLDQADMDDELLADQHRPDGPIAARRPVPPAAWEKLLAPSAIPGLGAVLAAIEDAAIAARLDELRAEQKLPQLDPQTRQDPQTSTVSAIRAFGFAARLLGVQQPDLYILPDAPGGVAAVAAERPTTVIGRSLLSGRSVLELAFLMARHLAYHRPGARLSLYYPSLNDLSALLYAAVQIGRPGVSVSSPNAAAAGRLYGAIHPRLDDRARAAVAAALTELDQAGRRPDLSLWMRRLELTATRAGFLACGDLNVAARLIENDPAPVGDLPPRAKADDLLVFAISDSYEALRREILSAEAPPSSVRPPPSSVRPPPQSR